MRQIDKEFKNPGVEHRAKPFWSWNGELTTEELMRQIDVLEDMGFGGFFMHSRTGLQTEYLGEDWFRLTNECADEAKKRALCVCRFCRAAVCRPVRKTWWRPLPAGWKTRWTSTTASS